MSVERRRMLMAAGRAPVSNGIYILYTDETVSPYNTLTPGKTPVGVLLKNEYVSIVIHPSEGSGTWSPDTHTVIPGVTAANTAAAAVVDYAGESNTNAAIASGLAGTAFTFAREAVYADGSWGYLPACGEMEQMRINETNINTALNLIGGTQLNFGSRDYWSSTQSNTGQGEYYGSAAYGWGRWQVSWGGWVKYGSRNCRSVATYE